MINQYLTGQVAFWVILCLFVCWLCIYAAWVIRRGRSWERKLRHYIFTETIYLTGVVFIILAVLISFTITYLEGKRFQDRVGKFIDKQTIQGGQNEH